MFYFLSVQVTVAYVVLIFVMFLFCLVMLKQNNILKGELKKLREERDALLYNKEDINKSNDTVAISEISKDMVEEVVQDVKEEVRVMDNKDIPLKKDSVDIYKANMNNHGDLLDSSVSIMDNKKESSKDNKKGYYTRNVLHDKKHITSPVSIDNKVVDTDNFNINDFVRKDKNKSGEDSSNKRRDSFSYLQEVSQELANATSNTIELTDYEKREEDNAIISYQELLKVKDKIKVIDDDNGDVDFLEELKSFRNSLN